MSLFANKKPQSLVKKQLPKLGEEDLLALYIPGNYQPADDEDLLKEKTLYDDPAQSTDARFDNAISHITRQTILGHYKRPKQILTTVEIDLATSGLPLNEKDPGKLARRYFKKHGMQDELDGKLPFQAKLSNDGKKLKLVFLSLDPKNGAPSKGLTPILARVNDHDDAIEPHDYSVTHVPQMHEREELTRAFYEFQGMALRLFNVHLDSASANQMLREFDLLTMANADKTQSVTVKDKMPASKKATITFDQKNQKIEIRSTGMKSAAPLIIALLDKGIVLSKDEKEHEENAAPFYEHERLRRENEAQIERDRKLNEQTHLQKAPQMASHVKGLNAQHPPGFNPKMDYVPSFASPSEKDKH